jgi:hypothetical protein
MAATSPFGAGHARSSAAALLRGTRLSLGIGDRPQLTQFRLAASGVLGITSQHEASRHIASMDVKTG